LVKSSFFGLYHASAGFGDFFPDKRYNSISAAALYALILEQLNIPFALKELPTHVSVVTYPEQQKLQLETVPLQFSYRIFDARYQESFIKNLKNGSRINTFQGSNFSNEDLFNHYFFINKNFGLPELVSLHYLNDTYSKNDNNDFKGAFKQCEKAYLLLPSPRQAYLLMALAAEILDKQKLTPKERAVYIAKLSRYSDSGITQEMIQGEFARLTDELLIRQNNRTLYQECADFVVANGLQDDETRNTVRYLQYYELGRTDYNQGRYALAKLNLARALQLKPNDIELSAGFYSALTNSLQTEQDGNKVLDTVLTYKKRFPTLLQNNNFNALLANAYLMASAEAMTRTNLALAEERITEFETIYNSDKTLLIEAALVGSAYSKLCSHYFKKGQKEKAKNYLNKGLAISPDNYELRIRQQMIGN
jgi:tetratricopeptide (TPR) repeat protein